MKKIILLFVIIASYFVFNTSNNYITDIRNNYSEVFKEKPEPYEIVVDCVQGHPRDGAECTERELYTEEDQEVLDQQDDLLGPYPVLKNVAFLIMIISAVWLIISIYSSFSDARYHRNQEKKWDEKNRLEKEKQNDIAEKLAYTGEQREEYIRQYVEDVKKYMLERGTSMLFSEGNEIKEKAKETRYPEIYSQVE